MGRPEKTGACVALQLKSPSGDKIEQAIRIGFSAYNNESEFEAILAGLELAALSDYKLLVKSDSQLVVGQVNEEFKSQDPRMEKYVSRVKQRLSSFPAWKLEHIPINSNEKVDALASTTASLPIIERTLLSIYYQPT